MLLRDHGWGASWRKILVGYLVGPGLGLAAGVLWTRYSDAVKMENPFTGFLTSSSLAAWNFGTLSDRVSPSLHYIAFRVMDLMAGLLALTLVAAVVAIILTKRSRVELLSLVAVPFAAVAIFMNLYIQHEYYLAAVFPAIASLVAVGIVAVSRKLGRRWSPRVALAAILAAAVLALSWVSPLGQNYAALFTQSAAVPAAAASPFNAHSRPGTTVPTTNTPTRAHPIWRSTSIFQPQSKLNRSRRISTGSRSSATEFLPSTEKAGDPAADGSPKPLLIVGRAITDKAAFV